MPFIQFRIHPSVGIARMGNSRHAFYLASDFPYFLQELYPNLRHRPRPLPHPLPPSGTSDPSKAHFDHYRDDDGGILPQAARFRVFAYVYDNANDNWPSQVIEMGPDHVDIEWTVQLANLKSVTPSADPTKPNGEAVLNQPPAKTLKTKSADGPEQIKDGTKITLGVAALEKDPADAAKLTNRLLLIGNEGETRPTIPTPPGTDLMSAPGLYKNDWHDSEADGSVTATVLPKAALKNRFPNAKYLSFKVKDPLAEAAATRVEALSAWVVVGPPDYAPDTGHLISLWDLAVDHTLMRVLCGKAIKPVDGQHKSMKKGEKVWYWNTDYFVHLHPQLTLFTDLDALSNQVRSAASPDRQDSADIEGTLATGPDTSATSITISQDLADKIAIAARWHPSRPAGDNLDPFVIILTEATDGNFTGTLGATGTPAVFVRHEYVGCKALTAGNKLTITRDTPALDWSSGGSVRFIARTPFRVHECKLGAPITATTTKISLPMADARMLVEPPAGVGFMIKIVEGANTEWVECTANDASPRAPSSKTAELTVARGKNGTTARAFGATAKLFALAIGHKTLDVRADRALPQARRKLIFERLRKPATLYDRPKFVSDQGGERSYPRLFGRHTNPANPEEVTVTHFPSTDVDVDPDGSLTRFLAVVKRPPGKPGVVACNARPPQLQLGASLTPSDGAKFEAIDDFYWPWTQTDMPMLKDYAFTHLQFEQFWLWASNKSNIWLGNREFDKSGVLAAFFGAAHTPDEYFAHLVEKKPKFAPSMIDMANLGAILGGSFMPGIEVGFDGGMPENWSVYHGATFNYYPDVRFWPHEKSDSHVPGRLTVNLAIPWQKDFDACNETFWPTSRPQIVRSPRGSTYPWLENERHQATDEEFQKYWFRLGFIRRDGNRFEERESSFSRP